jgi:hypothetical protein
MDVNKLLSLISRLGSVILTTVLSFVVLPPSIDGGSNSVINWKNIFTFFAGILTIFLYDRLKQKKGIKKTPFFLVTLLVLCAGAYEVIYNQYSIRCFDKLPVIISACEVRSEMKDRLAYWKIHSQDPIKSLLESNDCSSTNIWPWSAIAVPYYSLIILYFLIIITVVALLVLASDLATLPKT